MNNADKVSYLVWFRDCEGEKFYIQCKYLKKEDKPSGYYGLAADELRMKICNVFTKYIGIASVKQKIM